MSFLLLSTILQLVSKEMLDILKIQTQTVVVVGNKNADHTTTSAY